MTQWTHRVMIVPAAMVDQARAMADAIGPAGSGMWTTLLSPTGEEPATHYISTGLIEQAFADMLDSAEVMRAGMAQFDVAVTLEECAALLDNSTVSTGDPFEVMAEMGLQIVTPAEPPTEEPPADEPPPDEPI
jgi:hypothetical protein